MAFAMLKEKRSSIKNYKPTLSNSFASKRSQTTWSFAWSKIAGSYSHVSVTTSTLFSIIAVNTFFIVFRPIPNLKKAIENFDLPKNYQPDILVWKLIKRYYNQKAGAGMEAVLNIKRGIHNVALAASKLNELLNDKLSDGASLEDVPVVIGYMKQINDLANQFPNTIKALNVAEENLLYEQENVAGRGGVEITSSMIEE